MAVDPDRLSEFLEESGLSYKRTTTSYILRCTECGKDKIGIRKRDGRWRCWFCDKPPSSRPEYLFAEMLGVKVVDVRDKLYGAGAPNYADVIDLSGFGSFDDELDEDLLPIEEVVWEPTYRPITDVKCGRGQAYLVGRGVPLELAAEYGLRFSPEDRRVGFPITLDGRLVGFQKRWVGEPTHWDEEKQRTVTVPKILSSKEIPSSRVVMFSQVRSPCTGLSNRHNRQQGQNQQKNVEAIIICEGPFDAIKCHLCPNSIAVATMGKAVAKGQIQFIRNLALRHGVEKIYVALDPDASSETSRLLREFGDLETYLLQPTHHKDLGEMGLEEVRDLFLAAPRVTSSYWPLRMT